MIKQLNKVWAWDFYEGIVKETEGRINYLLIQSESESEKWEKVAGHYVDL